MAIAYTLSSLMTAVVLLLLLNKKMKGIDLREMFRYTVRTLIASLLMGIVILALKYLLGSSDSKLVQVVHMIVEFTAGGIIFVMAAFSIRIGEISKVFRFLLYRIGLILNKIKIVK
jgi:putative peptidoglycan lipid II flippase